MPTNASILDQLRHVSVEDLLLPLLLQLILILAVARVFGWLFRRFGQPAVVGEIVAGIVLGPSVFGLVSPELFAAVFRPALPGVPPEAADVLLSKILTAVSQLGLILTLFLVGLEFDFSHLKWHGKTTLAVAVAGLVLPFALGATLGAALHPHLAPDVSYLGFVLLLGTALAITAIPVLGRMMLEMGITRTRLATITISAAAAEDACGWILLASVAAHAHAQFDAWHTLGMLCATIAFGLGMVFVARPILARFLRHTLAAGGGELGVNGLAVVLVLVLLCSVITNVIGVFAVFGAFTLGAILSAEHEFRDACQRSLRDFVTSFFLPVFFAYTGLRTDIGTLESPSLWLIALLVCTVAIVGKFGGCALAGWLTGLKPREAACVGAMMNTRGLMELVVVNVGKDLGLIPESVYCMLVLMAIVTTVMTTPLLVRLMRGTELEASMRASGFVAGDSPGARADP